MSLPTPVIKLDDGTGTYPTVITNSVRWADGVSLSGFGRSDEFSTAQPSTMTLTLDNASGAFSTGAGAVSPGQGIRWTETSGATTVDRFTGRISSAELAWPTGGQEFSTVVLTCIDPLAELARHPLRSMLEQDILVDNPIAYYTLGEPAGSTSAGDTSGNQNPPMASTGGGAAVVFGNGTGPVDGLTAAQFNALGQQLQTLPPASFSPSQWSLEVFVATSVVPALPGAAVAFITTGAELFINNLGQIQYLGTSGSITGPVITDGATHQIAVTHDAHNANLYVDGALIFGSPVADTLVSAAGFFTVGGFTGTLSHVALYGTTLSAARVASHSSAAITITETTDARMTRLASYVGTTCTTSSGSGQLVTRQDTTGQNALDAMQAVAESEGGVLFVDGSGVLRMQGRNYRGLKTAATLALVAEDPDAGTRIPYDTQQLVNSVTVSRTNGAEQRVQDASATSATGPGMFAVSLDLIVADDASALYAAQWLVGKHKTPAPRISSMTVNMLSPVTSAASVLALTVGDRVSLVLPSQTWASAGDYTIEGWAETLSISEWSITFNLVPWSLNQAWILGDATYGVLGSTTILGY